MVISYISIIIPTSCRTTSSINFTINCFMPGISTRVTMTNKNSLFPRKIGLPWWSSENFLLWRRFNPLLIFVLDFIFSFSMMGITSKLHFSFLVWRLRTCVLFSWRCTYIAKTRFITWWSLIAENVIQHMWALQVLLDLVNFSP